jgi:hypothetical protein
MFGAGEMSPEEFSKFLMELVKNKEAVLLSLIKDIDSVDAHVAGVKLVLPSLEKETTEANLRQQLSTALRMQSKQAGIMKKLLMFALLSASTGDIQHQAAKVASLFGKGEDALKELWKQKMQGV